MRIISPLPPRWNLHVLQHVRLLQVAWILFSNWVKLRGSNAIHGGCLPFAKSFRKIRLEGKWSKTSWVVPAENFRDQRDICQDSPGALFIQPKLSKIRKQRQMGQKFPGEFSRNSESCWISDVRTIQKNILEISGAKLNGKKTFGKSFRKFGYSSRGCPRALSIQPRRPVWIFGNFQ